MFEIRFQGFLTHARLTKRPCHAVQRVVMYDVPHQMGHEHIPLLTVREGDLCDPQSAPKSDFKNGRGIVRCYKLRGHKNHQLTKVFTDIPPGKLPSLKLKGIPRINGVQGVSNGKYPCEAIAAFTPTKELPVLVDLTDGALAIEDWFERRADFGKPIGVTCVPRTITYAVQAPADKTCVTIYLERYWS